MFRNFDDDYHVEEASDDEEYISSEEEVDDVAQFLAGLDNPEFAILKNTEEKQDFESEMNSELEKAIVDHEVKYDFATTSKSPSKDAKGKQPSADDAQQYYDDAYFDSDDDEDDDKPVSDKNKRRVLSNDELFYDPDMDDADQKWVDDTRRTYLPKTPAGQKQKPLPKSDATLTCPACMTVLCFDCQRHELYSSQFRAMFVKNCKVNFSESLHYPEKTKKFKKQKQAQASASASDAKPSDLYHPVSCSICKTEVAVYDSEEIYHFFNVLAGS